LRDITQQDIDDYNRDGVVCLAQGGPLTDCCLSDVREVIIDHKDVGLLPTTRPLYGAVLKNIAGSS
jgi:hypothetical protein